MGGFTGGVGFPSLVGILPNTGGLAALIGAIGAILIGGMGGLGSKGFWFIVGSENCLSSSSDSSNCGDILIFLLSPLPVLLNDDGD